MKIKTPKGKKLKLEVVELEEKSSFKFKEDRPSHFPFHWHYHPEIELTLILKGRGLRYVGDSMEPFSEGDLCLIGSNLPHTWFSQDCDDVATDVIQFKPDFLGQEFLSLPEFKAVRTMLRQGKYGLHFSALPHSEVIPKIESLKNKSLSSSQKLITLLSILSDLAEKNQYRTLSATAMNFSGHAALHPQIHSLCTLIQKNFPDTPTQAEAAIMTGYSAAAFTRFFKNNMGKTYLDYISELRMGMACRALTETDKSILEIARESGFNNLSNFNRQFLGNRGVTPKVFRKRQSV